MRLISLQKGEGIGQLDSLPDGMAVESLGGNFPEDFVETAAAMEAMDLIITCDTSVAHLAGALGRPVWVALRYAADWRWLLDRPDSPWYPGMRLFRQNAQGDWRKRLRGNRSAAGKISGGKRKVIEVPQGNSGHRVDTLLRVRA